MNRVNKRQEEQKKANFKLIETICFFDHFNMTHYYKVLQAKLNYKPLKKWNNEL